MENRESLFIEYRNLLFSIAYNMLGQVEAAQDIVQDTFLIWMEIDTAPIRHPKAFLVKIVTNTCINYLSSGRITRETYVGVWLPEPLQDCSPDKAQERIETWHALSIGLMVLLERLTPRERAIFLLKEVFAYDYYELAELFEITTDNARQIMRRAKEHLGEDSHRFEVDLRTHEKILNKFLRATLEGDLEELISLLKEDIVMLAEGSGRTIDINGQRLSAVGKPIHGKRNVAKLLTSVMPKFLQHLPGLRWEIVMANGLPSILSFNDDEPFGLVSIESDGERIRNIYLQTNPGKLHQFNHNRPSNHNQSFNQDL
ncbi:MAG TPA: sigma-70 family RNA polymerase sigma factor [Puia sp.]|nr:sigma-70 family RNA polymerase sigma factor [Puia sp.]